MKLGIKHISERKKLLLLSLVVGLGSGFAAVVLTWLIHAIKAFINDGFAAQPYNWQFLIFPGIGMFLSLVLLHFVIKDDIGHGVTKVLLAVSRNESRIKPHNMWSSVVTSAVTIGFGGSVGAEAPIVYTGAAIGSNLGKQFNLSYHSVTILLGCGAAGAVAGIFKAPLAGVLFTIEILLFNVSMSSMLPLLISTISATVVSYIFLGQTPVFACTLTPFEMVNLPFYIVLGVVAGFGALYFTNGTLKLEDRLSKFSNRYLKCVLCALGLGLLIFLFPPLYGEGYDSLGALLNGQEITIEGHTFLSRMMDSPWGVPVFFALIFFAKVIAMTLTNAGGGVGGTFGPTLFAGAILGFVVARTMNLTLANTGFSVPEQNFVLVGMAAMMAAVMQAPMTAIFLIAEISGGYGLFIPLILSATVAYGTVRIFDHYSIYTKRIAQTGELLTHDNDQSVLTLLQTKDLIRDKYPRMRLDDTLDDVVKTISRSGAAVFAVVDEDGHYQGMLDIGNIRKLIFRTDLYKKLHVRNIMEEAPALVHDTDTMSSVMAIFDKTQAWRLPVLDADGRYLGFISRSRILTAYRDELKVISQD
ncbi:MAG: chloride channel protein [Bacteroidales bacterium]|nr:chloride channel protein [Bacteroidales bacterium]